MVVSPDLLLAAMTGAGRSRIYGREANPSRKAPVSVQVVSSPSPFAALSDCCRSSFATYDRFTSFFVRCGATFSTLLAGFVPLLSPSLGLRAESASPEGSCDLSLLLNRLLMPTIEPSQERLEYHGKWNKNRYEKAFVLYYAMITSWRSEKGSMSCDDETAFTPALAGATSWRSNDIHTGDRTRLAFYLVLFGWRYVKQHDEVISVLMRHLYSQDER